MDEGEIDAAEMLEDVDGDDDEIKRAIDNDIAELTSKKESMEGKPLTSHAEGELNRVHGIHVWEGVKQALAETFPGWPGMSKDYDWFCARVESELAANPRKDPAAFARDLFKKEPYVAHDFDAFIRRSPLQIVLTKKMENLYRGVLKIMVRGVKYVSAEKRAKYKVELGPILQRGGEIFDTSDIYSKKKQTSAPGSTTKTNNPAKKLRCIWVMTSTPPQNYTFFSHFGKLGRFHHSSFMEGSAVMAAGEWYVEKGRCLLINACSGHYQPEPWRFLRAYQQLEQRGVISPETELQAWKRTNPDASGELRTTAATFMNRFDENLRTYQLYSE